MQNKKTLPHPRLPVMMTLYDSESFAVVHLMHDAVGADLDGDQTLVTHGFEILDKRTGKGIYLDGTWADTRARDSPIRRCRSRTGSIR